MKTYHLLLHLSVLLYTITQYFMVYNTDFLTERKQGRKGFI